MISASGGGGRGGCTLAGCWVEQSVLVCKQNETLSATFHVRSTTFKYFLCFPVTDVNSVPGFTNSSSPLTLLARLLAGSNQRNQRASLEADAVGRRRALPPHGRPR